MISNKVHNIASDPKSIPDPRNLQETTVQIYMKEALSTSNAIKGGRIETPEILNLKIKESIFRSSHMSTKIDKIAGKFYIKVVIVKDHSREKMTHIKEPGFQSSQVL